MGTGEIPVPVTNFKLNFGLYSRVLVIVTDPKGSDTP